MPVGIKVHQISMSVVNGQQHNIRLAAPRDLFFGQVDLVLKFPGLRSA